MALADSQISEVRVANAVFLAYHRSHLIFNVFDNAQALSGVRGTSLLTDGNLGKGDPNRGLEFKIRNC